MTRDEVRTLLALRSGLTSQPYGDNVIEAWHESLRTVDELTARRAMHDAAKRRGTVRVTDLWELLNERSREAGERQRSDYEHPPEYTGEAISYEDGIRIAMREATKVGVDRRLAVGLRLDASSEALWAAELEARVRRAVPKPSDEDVLW